MADNGTEVLIGVRIEGISPLLVHAFTDGQAMAASEGTAAVAVGDRGTPREQAEASLYKDMAGKPIMPGPNLYRSFIDAGTFHKVGKSKVTTQKTSLVPTACWVEEVTIPIQSKEPWMVDTRPIRIPATGGRVLRHRPKFENWALDFTLRVDTATFSEKFMRQLVDDAGKKIGLGDFRPACKGPFGRFVVTQWKRR